MNTSNRTECKKYHTYVMWACTLEAAPVQSIERLRVQEAEDPFVSCNGIFKNFETRISKTG